MSRISDDSADHEPLPLGLVTSSPDSYLENLPDELARSFDWTLDRNPQALDRAVGTGELFGIAVSDDVAIESELLSDRPVEPLREVDDEAERRRFVNCVFGYYRWKQFLGSDPDFGDLVDFHAREKMTLLAHDPERKGRLGDRLSSASDEPLDRTLDWYGRTFMEALHELPTRSRHVNVLEHLYGYIKEVLDDSESETLLDKVRAFRRGEVPLDELLLEFREAALEHSSEWLRKQSYLNPSEVELRFKRTI